jgi:acyl-CoA thioesterase FadM
MRAFQKSAAVHAFDLLLRGFCCDSFTLVSQPPTILSLRSSHSSLSHLSAHTPSALDIAIQNATDSQEQSSVSFFRSIPYQVFIEDTDAYGVMYNANYLRAYDRALHMTAATASLSSSSLHQHDEWSIVSVQQQKFKKPPTLGGSFVIEGHLRESGIHYEVWDMIMKSLDGTVYNTADGVRIEHPPSTTAVADAGSAHPTLWLPLPDPLDCNPKGTPVKQFTHSFTTFRDEYDPHLEGCMPLRNILNLMERTRSSALGGPNVLHQLQSEDHLLFVVSECRNVSLVQSATRSMRPGSVVQVCTDVVMKRKGMMWDFYHTVYVDQERLAQGIVTLVTIDARSRRPTNNLPAWLLDLFTSTTD